ncbi:carboxymuconolactone decarboxylase family protein [Erythrobacter sp.]|uniref:carboxymuconolactone decarboxylase family protein n=1 Tax=Erythrobacter sp. TaxID=1042 RepID=UPI0025C4DD07|nr:carboxymuconolactone decarboxylase family protein [Erythrobacter sp.]
MKTDRIDAYKAAPEAMKAMMGVEEYIQNCSLDVGLIELVRMRASQINGCAFCLDLHSKDARKAGETEQRLYLLDAWYESHLYSEREKAALAWTDALTKIAENHAPDELFDDVREHFADREMADLTTLIALINAWNRLAISLRYQHG